MDPMADGDRARERSLSLTLADAAADAAVELSSLFHRFNMFDDDEPDPFLMADTCW